MLEQAITEIQNIERSVARKTLSDLQIRLALRSCLKELRVVRRVPPAAREQLGHQSPPGSSSLEIKRLPVGQRQLVEIHDGETEEKSGQGLEGRSDPRPQTPVAVMSPGPLDQTPRARTRHFFSTRQLSPAALSEPQNLAAAFIDTKGPIEAR